MIYLSSIQPLDVLEHAFDTPLIIEVYVLHTYQPEDWDYSFGFWRQNRIPFHVPFLGKLARPGEEEIKLDQSNYAGENI